VDENRPLSFSVSATDPDPNQTLTLTTAGLPAGASVVAGTALNTWLFRWTPGFSQAGTYTVSFTATDNGAPPLGATRTVQITVRDVPTVAGSQ
jgi:hypothetical protein